MSFISWQYFIFLPVIVISYWLLPPRRRLLLLLAGSYFFYGCWDVRFLALVLATTVIDYNCGLAIAGRAIPRCAVFDNASCQKAKEFIRITWPIFRVSVRLP